MSYKQVNKILSRGITGDKVMHYCTTQIRPYRYEGETIAYESKNIIPDYITNIFNTKDNTHSKLSDWTIHWNKITQK